MMHYVFSTAVSPGLGNLPQNVSFLDAFVEVIRLGKQCLRKFLFQVDLQMLHVNTLIRIIA